MQPRINRVAGDHEDENDKQMFADAASIVDILHNEGMRYLGLYAADSAGPEASENKRKGLLLKQRSEFYKVKGWDGKSAYRADRLRTAIENRSFLYEDGVDYSVFLSGDKLMEVSRICYTYRSQNAAAFTSTASSSSNPATATSSLLSSS